ncbi:MAG: MBL fold metallo-hydrolase [Dethiobacteria bacterium]|jgi:7,8-dihydropterin-6-yl-methyl-4-(beta-D-ribofuranosyl)aminobenzene 5'-phosphate synthase
MLQAIGEVDSVRVTTLLDDYAGYETPFYAQHGIALLVEISSGGLCKRILLDVGQSAVPILHNMEILGLDPGSIDAIFLSHCHYDHTEGLVDMLKAVDRESVPVIAHTDIFRENYIFDPFIRNIGITAKNGIEAIKAAGGQMVLTKEAFEIAPGVLSTGVVPRRQDFEKQGIGTYNLVDGAISGDKIEDDLSIVVNVKDVGLVVLVGCSHAGIVNIVTHAKELTGIDRVEAVMGGFHLIEAPAERIARTAEALKEMEINRVVAGHCTGLKACAELGRVLGDRFQLLHSGKILNVP